MQGATHEYKLEVGEQTFKGDIAIGETGIQGYEQDGAPYMPEQTRHAIESIINLLGKLPVVHGELKTFKVSIKV